jgi:hypothetical protein
LSREVLFALEIFQILVKKADLVNRETDVEYYFDKLGPRQNVL